MSDNLEKPFAIKAVQCIETLKEKHANLLKKIRMMIAISDTEYETFIEPVLLNLISFYEQLPASKYHHHAFKGGLLHHTLEVSYYALVIAERQIFEKNGSPFIRKQEELKWRVAVLICALLHDFGKIISDYKVVDHNSNLAWNPFRQSLIDWLKEYQIDTYIIQWQTGRYNAHQAFNNLGSHLIIGAKLYTWLGAISSKIIRCMTESLNHTNRENIISAIVLKADQLSVESNLSAIKLQINNDDPPPIVKLIQSIMIDFYQQALWKINQKGARLWLTTQRGTQEVYLVWKAAITDILTELKTLSIYHPFEEFQLLELLETCQLVAMNGEEKAFYKIAPKELGQLDKKIFLNMVRIKAPSSLIDNIDEIVPQILEFQGEELAINASEINTINNPTLLSESSVQVIAHDAYIQENLNNNLEKYSNINRNIESVNCQVEDEENDSNAELTTKSIDAISNSIQEKNKKISKKQAFTILLQQIKHYWYQHVVQVDDQFEMELAILRTENRKIGGSDTDLVKLIIEHQACHLLEDGKVRFDVDFKSI